MNCALYHSFGTPKANPFLSWKFSEAVMKTSLHGTLKLMKDRAPSELWNIMNHLLTHSAYQWVWHSQCSTSDLYYCYYYLLRQS